MKSSITRWMCAFGLAVSAAAAVADPKHGSGEVAKMPNCPVMGEAADLGVSVATDQGPVFFCCPPCIKKYNKEPAKYAEQVAEQRKALAERPKIQVICPVHEKPVDQKFSIDHEGGKVYFCGDGCSAKYLENTSQYAAKLANAYTWQTVCPVMKEEIDPAVFADLASGQRVYLCCKKCAKRMTESPLKYKDALAEQGLHLDEEKLGGKGD